MPVLFKNASLWLVRCMMVLCTITMSAQAAFAVCGDGTLDANEQCDDGRLDDGDGCSSQCQIENPSGCADGTREGFVSATRRYSYIAGCGGGWSIPGARSIPACDRQAGDDSQNPTGTGCSAADLCAVGWHVCGSTNDVRNSLGANGTCNDAADPAGGTQYYATQVSGPGTGNCSTNPGDTNDNFGCGNVGASPAQSCSPLNRFSNNLCSALPATDGWTCAGANGFTEQTRIRKTLPQGGGVMCCFGPGLTISITTPGPFTNVARPTISGTTDAADGTTISVVLPDQSIVTTTANNGMWSVAWPNGSAALVDGVESTIEASAYSPETGFSGTRSKTTYVVCGNGVTSGQEQCDDNNTDNGDGCDEFCQFEQCGNGLVQANEACDDGNTAGGDGCSATCAIEQDYTCPIAGGQCLTVEIGNPMNNGAYQSEPSYSGTATPGAAVTLEFTDSNGVIVRTAVVIADQNGAWSAVAQNLPEGEYTLTASVTTSGGTQSDQVTYTIDSTPPSLTLTAPADGSVTTDSTPAIEGQTENNVNVDVEIRDSNNMVVQTLATSILNGDYSTNALNLSDGTYTATAIATDAAGNQTTVTNTFTVDTTTFVIILAPTTNTTTQDNTPTISGTMEVGATLVLEIRDANGAVVETINATNNNGAFSEDAAQLPDGTYTITATATDALGNTSSEGPVVITIDTVTSVAITSPADGTTTANTQPTLQGMAEAGANVVVTVTDANGAVVLTETVNADANTGAWSVSPQSNLGDGTYTITATATDAVGNTASASNSFTIDTTALPLDITAPAPGTQLNDNTPEITGTTAPNTAVQVIITDANGNAVETLSTTSDAQGNWTVTAAMLTDGSYTATATVTNAANTSSTAATSFDVDTTAPAITLDAPADNSTTGDNTPAISGTTEANATVQVTIEDENNNVVETVSVQADAAGQWSVDASQLSDGEYTVTATVMDQAGNSASAGPNSFSVDTSGPTVTIATPADGSTTSETQPTLTGTSDPNTDVVITVTDAQGTVIFTTTVTADANGDWSASTDMALGDGDYTVNATATDAVGNTTMATPVTFTVDTTAPMITITSPSNGDSTEDTTPTITGTAPAGATVTIEIDGVEVGEATADAQGNWSFDVPEGNALATGEHTIVAKTVDAGGNEGTSEEVKVNVVEPKAPITIDSPTNGAETTGPKVTVTGTGEPGEEITVTVGGETTTVTVDDQGNWSVDVDVPDGEVTINAKSGDREANVTITVTPQEDTTAYLLQGGCGNSTTGMKTPSPALPLGLLVLGLFGVGVRRRRQ